MLSRTAAVLLRRSAPLARAPCATLCQAAQPSDNQASAAGGVGQKLVMVAAEDVLNNLFPRGAPGILRHTTRALPKEKSNHNNLQWYRFVPQGNGVLFVQRPETEKVVERLRKVQSGEWKRTANVFDGPAGIGKSHSLAEVSLWAKDNGWEVISLGHLSDFALGNGRWTRLEDGSFNQWSHINELMESFVEANADFLERTECNVKMGSKEHSNLLSVAKAGTDTRRYAQLALQTVLEGARNQTHTPVLFAADDVNAAFGPSFYVQPPLATRLAAGRVPHSRKGRLDAQQLVIMQEVKALMTAQSQGKTAFVCAATRSGSFGGHKEFPYYKYMPAVQLQPFDIEQTRTLLQGLRQLGYVSSFGMTDLTTMHLKGGGVPYDIAKEAGMH